MVASAAAAATAFAFNVVTAVATDGVMDSLDAHGFSIPDRRYRRRT